MAKHGLAGNTSRSPSTGRKKSTNVKSEIDLTKKKLNKKIFFRKTWVFFTLVATHKRENWINDSFTNHG